MSDRTESIAKTLDGVNFDEAFRKRFWEKVNKEGPIVREELGHCWLWTGNTINTGRGTLGVGYETHLAHRVSYAMEVGPLEKGKFICHACDVENWVLS